MKQGRKFAFPMFVHKGTHPVLWMWHAAEMPLVERYTGFFIDREQYEKFRAEADEVCEHLNTQERDAWAAYAAKTHPGFHAKAIPGERPEAKTAKHHLKVSYTILVMIALVLFLLLLFLVHPTKAEPRFLEGRTGSGAFYHITFFDGLFPQLTTVRYNFTFDASNNLKVNCITGCSASAGFTDNSAFTVGATTVNPIAGYFTTGAAPAISSGNAGRIRMDASSFLMVNCQVGCSGSSFADNAAFTAGTTAIGITGGWYSTSPTNCTSGDACAPQLTIDRKLFVNAFQGTSPWVVSASGNFGVTQQTSPWVDNITQFGGNNVVTGTGASGVGIPRVTVSNDSNILATQSGTWTVQQGGAPWSVTGTLTDNNATPTTNNIGVLPCRADTNTRAVTVTDQVLLSCDANDLLRVSLKDTPANTNNLNVNLAASAATVTVSGTVTANQGTANATPWNENIAQVAGTSLGATGVVNYGSTPAAVAVPGVNAFVTNTVAVSGTVTANAGTGQFNVTCTAANCPMNVAQFGGANVVTGTGTSGAGIPRVTVSSDSFPATQPVSGTVTANIGTTNGLALDASVKNVQGTVAPGTAANNSSLGGCQYNTNLPELQSGQQSAVNCDAFGRQLTFDTPVYNALNAIYTKPVSGAPVVGTFNRRITSTGDALDVNIKYPEASFEPCNGPNKGNVPVSTTANKVLIPGTGGVRYRICSIFLLSTSAESWSIVEGTGATCGTGIAAVIGSTTAANGPSFAANAGFTLGNGTGTVAMQNGLGNDLCILLSGSTLVAGNLTYAF